MAPQKKIHTDSKLHGATGAAIGGAVGHQYASHIVPPLKHKLKDSFYGKGSEVKDALGALKKGKSKYLKRVGKAALGAGAATYLGSKLVKHLSRKKEANMISLSAMVDESTEILNVKEAMLHQGGSDGKMPSKPRAAKLKQVGSDGGKPSSSATLSLKHTGSDGKKPRESSTLKLKFTDSAGVKPSKSRTLKLQQHDSAMGKPRSSAPSVALRAWSSAEKAKVGFALPDGLDKEAFLGIGKALRAVGGAAKSVGGAARAGGRAFKATKGMGMGARLSTAGGAAKSYLTPAAAAQRTLKAKGVQGASARIAKATKAAPAPIDVAARQAGKKVPGGAAKPSVASSSAASDAKASLMDKAKATGAKAKDYLKNMSPEQQRNLALAGAGGLATGAVLS